MSYLILNENGEIERILSEFDKTREDTAGKTVIEVEVPKNPGWIWDSTSRRFEEDINFHWNALRAERNRRLLEFDWTQLADIPEETKNKWIQYRQILRDLLENTTNPQEPEWPEIP